MSDEIIQISREASIRPRIAVVGATGLVGQVLLAVLEERAFPLAELAPLASPRSAGRRLRFRGEEVVVRAVGEVDFGDFDLVFFAATGGLSRELGPRAARRGAVVIDKSSTWRMDPGVPLVVPEVNGAALDGHRGIIACPNCTTIGVVMALEPLRRAAGLRRVTAVTLQAVSGVGRGGPEELAAQERARHAGRTVAPSVFPLPIAGNVLPLCGALGDDGTSEEERKLADETRKILGLPHLAVTATCVRVPVEVGHAAALHVETVEPLSPAEARAALSAFPGVQCWDPGDDTHPVPTPLAVAGGDDVHVGRVRRGEGDRSLWLWVVADNLRKGAALNAVQIAELLRRPR